MVMVLDNKLTKQIEEICAARGVRLTSQRKTVFELIVPVNAHQVRMNCWKIWKKVNRKLNLQLYIEHWIFC